MIVIGAGVAGLSAAIDLAGQGLAVTVLERAATVGGKLHQHSIGGAHIDAGPTVFTLRRVFDALFADAGTTLEQHLTLQKADVLARHAWDDGTALDLFADPARSADAIAAFAGPHEADAFRRFCARARAVHATLDQAFMHAADPSPLSLIRASGLSGLGQLWRIAPFSTLWSALGRSFADPRLRQLYARYATYSGSSPFLAPATLMLIADVEQQGVWLIDGGMQRLADALAGLALRRGAALRCNAHVAAVSVQASRANGVTLSTGEFLPADQVLVTADASALTAGLLGPAVAGAVPRQPRSGRSLSAVTWAIAGRASGFPLARHTVFFSPDYRREFDDILHHRRLPFDPTVYVCAQDRDAAGHRSTDGPERLFCLVNAPATGDRHRLTQAELAQCARTTFARLARCGLTIDRTEQTTVTTTPEIFARMFPGTGGALYGPAMHGTMAAFQRPRATTAIPGLYLAGGSTHPGPGVPMAALSGRMAAQRLLTDLASTSRSHTVAMPGGMSMRSAMTDSTASY